MIEIDQRQAPYPAAGERLDTPRAHAAHARHADVGARKCIERSLAIQSRERAEATRPRSRRLAQGSITVEPVVLRPSRSVCTRATSASR
jgi:hypothetical protein